MSWATTVSTISTMAAWPYTYIDIQTVLSERQQTAVADWFYVDRGASTRVNRPGINVALFYFPFFYVFYFSSSKLAKNSQNNIFLQQMKVMPVYTAVILHEQFILILFRVQWNPDQIKRMKQIQFC